MKNCVACAEEIQDEAILCRFCQTRQDDSSFLGVLNEEQRGAEEAQVVSAPQEQRNGLAIAALVLGILSVFLFETIVIPLVAVFLGVAALFKASNLARVGVARTGNVMAIISTVLGGLYFIVGLLVTIWRYS